MVYNPGIYMIEMRYLIVSWENSCVYGSTHRAVTANAILAGLGSYAFVKGVSPHTTTMVDYNIAKTPANFKQNIYQTLNGTTVFTKLTSIDNGTDWFRVRELVQRRLHLFGIWESYTAGALSRTTRYQWNEFHNVACNELRNCNPANNQYTPAFEEYARILEVAEEIAYKELKLTTETDTLTRFRITAMAEKWKQKINLVETQEHSRLLFGQMTQEFWGNTQI